MRARHLPVIALLFVIGWSISFALPSGELRDYGSFIASGRAGAEGLNPYGIYPLTFHVVLPGFDVWNPNLNPPVSIPVFAFFDRVHPQVGFRLWWGISLACYVAAVVLLAQRYRGRHTLVLVVWALALAGFWDTLALGQIYLPLVLAAAAAWVLLDRRRDAAAGLLIGVVVAVKPNFAVWPALLLLAGHRTSAGTAVLTAIVLSALPLLSYGTEIYLHWVELILSDRDRAGFLTNASMIGLAQRAGARALGLVASLALLLVLAWHAVRRRPDRLQTSTLGLLGGIAASPIAWVHYTLFLLPVFFARRWTLPVYLSAALLAVPVPLLLGYLAAPTWQQVTVGSLYNWAVLLALIGFMPPLRRGVSGDTAAPTLVFYDGTCGLCDRFVHFLLATDTGQHLRFAALQSELARRELRPAGVDPGDLDTVIVIGGWRSSEPRVLVRSRAVLHLLAQLGGGWGLLARAGSVVPSRLADALYAAVAKRRYRLFGRFDSCPVPPPEWRTRFVDDHAVTP